MYSSSLFQSAYTSKNNRYRLDAIVSHFLDLLHMKSERLYEHAVRVSNHSAATAVYMRLPLIGMWWIFAFCFLTYATAIHIGPV